MNERIVSWEIWISIKESRSPVAAFRDPKNRDRKRKIPVIKYTVPETPDVPGTALERRNALGNLES